jgi:precorrin-3B synthase
MRVGDSFCPGIAHAVPAKDGLLIRVRIPGGGIDAAQLRAIATASVTYADGQIEITSRANIQLRGIGDRALLPLVEDLTAAGFLPSPAHDRVRNLMVSPFAGLDADELLDTRPLARLLDERMLSDPVFSQLPPKFSIAIDGGGSWFSHEMNDLMLRAFPAGDSVCWHLSIGGIATPIVTATENAVACLLAASRMCLRLSNQAGIASRGKAIAAHPGAFGAAMTELAPLALALTPPNRFRPTVGIPIGLYSGKHPGFGSIVPSIPLGRISAMQAQKIAAIATDTNLDVRLSPWRGLVLGAVANEAAPQVITCLESLGLWVDGRDGYVGIAACAGITGCDASLTDVRRDAAVLAGHLAGRNLRPEWRVYFSGCEKQCAMRTPATVKLVAGQSGYRMIVDERCLEESCPPEDAIRTIASLHTGSTREDRREV